MDVPIVGRSAAIVAAATVIAGIASLIPAAAGKEGGAVRPDMILVCHTTEVCFRAKNTTGGTGIHGDSTYGIGVVGTTHANPNGFGPGSSGVYGRDFTPYGRFNIGVTGISTVGTGVYGHSIEGAGTFGSGDPGVLGDGYTNGHGFWTGVLAIGGAPGGSPAMATSSNYPMGSGITLFAAYDSNGTVLAYLDDNGNLFLNGQVYTGGKCHAGCIPVHTSSGKQVSAYVSREASPSIEDFGQARLVEGSGYVRFNSDFATTVDQLAPYLVFVTPHGDSRGLYVTGETASGFWVRENGGGRSTLSFDYRIVAKPLDANEQRLPEYDAHGLGHVQRSQAERDASALIKAQR